MHVVTAKRILGSAFPHPHRITLLKKNKTQLKGLKFYHVKLLFFILIFTFLIVAPLGASAGTIIKAPAYLVFPTASSATGLLTERISPEREPRTGPATTITALSPTDRCGRPVKSAKH